MNDHFITRLVAVLMIAAVAFTGCKKNDPDEKPTCTVTFDSTGGSAVDAQTIETGTPAKAPANPVRDGYEFLYWTLNGEQYVFSKPVTGNITLTAKWQEITADTEYWQVQWSLGGGAWPEGDNHETRTVKGGTLAEPNAPVKDGSTFEGWYKEAALTNKITFPHTVTADIALYAKWTGESGGEEPGAFTSIAALKAWLENQPDNTAETPYKIGLKGVNLDTNNGWGDLGLAIGDAGNKSKYIELDLSGCTGTVIPDGSTKISGGKITRTGVFLKCEKLTAITLPSGLVTVGENAFLGCKELVSVVLPETLTSVHDDAFYECSKLEFFVVPKSVTAIGTSAFYDCRSLTSVILSEELQTIGSRAFGGGSFSACKLTSVIIPAKVTSMGSDIFWNCSDLTEIVMLPATPPALDGDKDALGRPANNSYVFFTIKVPAASLNAYKAAAGWKDYAGKIVANE